MQERQPTSIPGPDVIARHPARATGQSVRSAHAGWRVRKISRESVDEVLADENGKGGARKLDRSFFSLVGWLLG